jgi:hypothetical protein
MRMGKKTLLFGCHQVLIHPVFVILGWIWLYGVRSLNGPILLACVIHDWGYWRMRTMDSDGLFHPIARTRHPLQKWIAWPEIWYHSRHLSQLFRITPSRLCWADKLGTAMMPSWLWGLLAHWSGEGYEYMENVAGNDYVAPEEFTLQGLIRFHRAYSDVWISRSFREAWETYRNV